MNYAKKLPHRKGIYLNRIVSGNLRPWAFGKSAHTGGVVREIQIPRDHLHQQLQAVRASCHHVRRR